jgi:4-oxalomesaconate tautomerase
MGSPDPRQVDGVGGAHPLTSKVAIVSKSSREDADIDYLFLQVSPNSDVVSEAQNCGNLLAGVGAFALETGLLLADGDLTRIRVHMVNTGGIAVATVQTPGGEVEYEGDARIDGVPGTSAPVQLEFVDLEGSSCGALLPTGSVTNDIDGITVTCIDNGMPVVLIDSQSLGKTGKETPAELEADTELCERVERIRLQAGQLMALGDVTKKTVPKMSLVSSPIHGGTLSTRTFIPHRVHDAIGVLGAVSVATACAIPGTVAANLLSSSHGDSTFEIEHPTGFFSVDAEVTAGADGFCVKRSALLRTARLLMRGAVCIPAKLWPSEGVSEQ